MLFILSWRSKQVTINMPQDVEITSSNKCSFCHQSICCNYITQQIDTPRSKIDFDHLLWQISHQNIRIYKEKRTWYLLIESRCNHLKAGGGCNIYESRPEVCRAYSNDYCEYDEPAEKNFTAYFPDYDSLLAFCKKRFKRWGS
jgi:uncharacterized protein